MPLTTRRSARGTCLICHRVDVTTYHYSYAHGLKPKDIFIYNDKIWRCSKHKVQSLDPHKMMGHYWLEHAHSYYKNLPYKTREPDDSTGRKIKRSSNKWRMLEEKPVSKKPTLKEGTPVTLNTSDITLTPASLGVVANTSDYPTITAEDIVNAFEKRVIQIDAQLEAKDKIISEQAKRIDETTKALNAVERELLNRKPLEEPTPARTDFLVGRLFKR